MVSVSLCMIVKNEATWLPRRLAAAAPFVDELVVVDTGSTDRSVGVARSFGAKVDFFPWRDHFADARNRSLELAVGDWILYLDADEILHSPTNLFRQLAEGNATAYDAYYPALFNYLTNGGSAPEEAGRVVRFFRNDPSILFRGRVHENLIVAPKRIGELPPELQIHHYGYIPETVMNTSKRTRNLDLLQMALAEETDPLRRLYLLSNLALLFVNTSRFGEAVAACTELIDDPRSEGFALLPAALFFRLISLKEFGQLAEALEESERILGRFPIYTEVRRLRADILAEQGRFADAERTYLEAISQPTDRPSWLERKGECIRANCWLGLGNLYATHGYLRQATLCLAKAILEEPPSEEALSRLREVLARFPQDELTRWLPNLFRSQPELRPFLGPDAEDLPDGGRP